MRLSSSWSLRRTSAEGSQAVGLAGVQSINFEFVINLKAAKSLGLDLPPMLLARADEVIEY
jgi:putative ABC transport system substrate-binding protein